MCSEFVLYYMPLELDKMKLTHLLFLLISFEYCSYSVD